MPTIRRVLLNTRKVLWQTRAALEVAGPIQYERAKYRHRLIRSARSTQNEQEQNRRLLAVADNLRQHTFWLRNNCEWPKN